jgi:hypothetical protein
MMTATPPIGARTRLTIASAFLRERRSPRAEAGQTAGVAYRSQRCCLHAARAEIVTGRTSRVNGFTHAKADPADLLRGRLCDDQVPCSSARRKTVRAWPCEVRHSSSPGAETA